MSSDAGFDTDLGAALEAGRVIQPLPDAVRSRALARARASLATAGRHRLATPARASRRFVVVALAASLAIAVVAASAVAALGIRAARRQASTPPVSAHATAPREVPTVSIPPEVVVPEEIAEEVPAAPKPQRSVRATIAQESYAAELELLTRAQVASAGRDYTNALALVAEHARRFPNGRLAEEREALRVRSLTGAGRAEEAQRAASAFAERFPRSVLLSRSGRPRN